MSIREYLNNNSAVATILAVVLLIVALGVIYWTSSGTSRGPISVYYYDMNTKKLIEATGETPPFDTGSGQYTYTGNESGPAGVSAAVYSCTDSCDDIEPGMTLDQVQAAGGHIAYLSRHSMEGKRLLEQASAGGEVNPEMYDNPEVTAQLYAVPGSDTWESDMSEAGEEIRSRYGTECPAGERAQSCLP